MAQAGRSQVPERIVISIDYGTTRCKCHVSEQSSGGLIEYPLRFRSSTDGAKSTEELDTRMVFWPDERDCKFGTDGSTKSGGHVFEGLKLASMGIPPFTGKLADACKALEEAAPQMAPFTQEVLFRSLFSYIKKTTQEYLRGKYDREFDEIGCYLTYPVCCSESLRILQLQEASAAGLKVMGAVSEPMSIAHALSTVAEDHLPGAKLIVDFGGATVDAVVVDMENGKIVQVCPTDGCLGGGQSIDSSIRKWLKNKRPSWNALSDDQLWILGRMSSQIEQCKRDFTGQSAHEVYNTTGDSVTIPARVMESFFRPILMAALKIVRKLCFAAENCGRPVRSVVCSGGTVGNRWFVEQFFKALETDFQIQKTHAIEDPGIVARGALLHARDPQVEDYVLKRNVGLGYDGDYDVDGRPHPKGEELLKGIGWIGRVGQGPIFDCLNFTKVIEPGSTDPGDHLIESELYVTPDESQNFAENHISTNNLITWECDITYPLDERILPQLTRLGTFSGTIPHDELFPPGTKMIPRNFEFQLTLKTDKDLLSGDFCVILKNGHRCSLKDVRYIALPLRPWSEYTNSRSSPGPCYKDLAESGPSSPSQQHSPSPSPVSISSSADNRDLSTIVPNRLAMVTRRSPVQGVNSVSQLVSVFSGQQPRSLSEVMSSLAKSGSINASIQREYARYEEYANTQKRGNRELDLSPHFDAGHRRKFRAISNSA